MLCDKGMKIVFEFRGKAAHSEALPRMEAWAQMAKQHTEWGEPATGVPLGARHRMPVASPVRCDTRCGRGALTPRSESPQTASAILPNKSQPMTSGRAIGAPNND